MNYAQEKLMLAVEVLATDSAPIQKRLENAFMYFPMLEVKDFPIEHQDQWKEILRDVTKEHPKADEGTIRATTSKLTDDEAIALAKRVYSLFMALIIDQLWDKP